MRRVTIRPARRTATFFARIRLPLAASVAVAAAALAGAALSTGCDDTTDDGITPVTGIVLRADGLFDNIGCGTGTDEVFRYVGVVADPSNGNAPVPNAVGVYACYADGNFDLPSPDGSNYELRVYAFDQAAYDAAGGDAALLATAGDDKALRALHPTYFTSCSASQQINIEVLAVCSPLVAIGLDASAPAVDASDASDASNTVDGSDAARNADAGDGSADDASDAASASDAADSAG